MLTPYVLARNMFDEMVDSVFSGYNSTGLMCTDIRETAEGYELAIDLPGVKKEDLSAELKDGYLCVSATVGHTGKQDETKGKFLRRERFVGTVRRSFYVGGKVTQEDIRARFEDGTLYLFVPKEEHLAAVEPKKLIAIEG